MKPLLIVAALVLLVSCDAPKHRGALSWHTIEIGDYLVDCPADFELIKEKGIDSYVGKLKGDSLTLFFDFGYYSGDFAPTLPEETEKHNIAIDTIDTHYRKRVTAKDPTAGITGIYIKDLSGFNESINSYLTLSIATESITQSQQKLVVKILATVRPKPGK